MTNTPWEPTRVGFYWMGAILGCAIGVLGTLVALFFTGQLG